MSKFDLHKTIINLCLTADAIDEYEEKLSERRDELENKLIDLYHVVELYDLTDSQIKKLYQEMKKVLQNRRKIKNDIYVGDIFNRKFLLQAVGDAMRRQHNAEYHCRAYTHSEINKILGAKILPIKEGDINGEEAEDGHTDML